MDIISLFKTSFKAILLNKTRSFLTMLGVIIGVCSVILLVSVGSGLQKTITDQFNDLGTNLIIIVPGKVEIRPGQDPSRAYGNNKLSEKEVENIKKDLKKDIAGVTPIIQFGTNTTYKANSNYATVMATQADFVNVLDIKTQKGRFFSESEDRSRSKVAIIGQTVIDELFKTEDPINKDINIEGKRFKVIGVQEPKGAFGGEDNDNILYIPYNTAKAQFTSSKIAGIYVKASEKADVDLVKKDIERALLRTLKADDFTLLTQEELLSSIQTILGSVTLALAGIAAISLVVGGVGISNIMLVSVTERTKEIGLRKAVGATPSIILTQFLLESITLSFLGGTIGIILGWGISLLLNSYISTNVTPWSVLLAFGFSALVGIIFGTAPAVKAAKKDPIDALRYE